MKRHIPNALTCCNLLCGALSVICVVYDGNFAVAFALILMGAVFDFLDGFMARLLGVSSPIGKELDSLADDITFGLAPASMLFMYIFEPLGYWALVALLVAPFSALRLAKFNLDERQTTSFIGLATPANAIFWGSLTAALSLYEHSMPLWVPATLAVLSLLSCYLLVSEIPFFSLKFKNMSWQDNSVRFVFLCGALLIIIAAVIVGAIVSWAYALAAGAAVIVWYVALSLFSQRRGE